MKKQLTTLLLSYQFHHSSPLSKRASAIRNCAKEILEQKPGDALEIVCIDIINITSDEAVVLKLEHLSGKLFGK